MRSAGSAAGVKSKMLPDRRDVMKEADSKQQINYISTSVQRNIYRG